MKLQQKGTDFTPAHRVELIATYTDRSTLMSCYTLCNLNPLCRTFVSDSIQAFTCRLYQGSVNTGTIVSDSSVTSQVGGLHYDASFYENYNQICDNNAPPLDRYLICTSGFWSCPAGTYWNGDMCLNQVYYGSSCNLIEMCRQDIGLVCSSCGTCSCQSTTIWNGTSCISVQSTSSSILPNDSSLTALWLLDCNAVDLMHNYNGTLVGNPSFVTGYVGQAIALANNNYILVPYIDFYLRSFTIELWVYVMDNVGGAPFFAQCLTISDNQCLHMGLNGDATFHLGFWNDDVNSLTTLSLNQWHHVAFVYDYNLRQRLIYLDGISLSVSITSPGASHTYLGQSGNTTIGKILPFSISYIGYIDHVSITYRVKTANETLNDATLVAYYTFDNGSTLDSGPNLLHGIAANQAYITGRINGAVQFNSSAAYFQAFGFTALGMSNTSFSIALWIKPVRINGTLIHLSTEVNGTGSCEAILGFSGSGSLIVRIFNSSVTGPVPIVNIWTHITYTFSINNGICLYINGILYTCSGGSVTREGPNIPLYITLANQLLGAGSCISGDITKQPYAGAVDELRIYNREISAAEAYALAS